jgi:hypothetical protein
MPESQRAYWLRQPGGGLALCLAALLALTPVAQLFPTAAWQAAGALHAASHASDGDGRAADEPAVGVPGDQPDARIVPRLPHVEGGLLAPPQKAALPRLSASIDSLPVEKATPQRAAAAGFHRSSVGTARKPTGPPS